ncbi:hypothetical protein BDK51DRAFT_36644 [Blyttiomyces helicus]|uniref:Uncharacterized protein n=1 Tax=Blyttiomyces helicus TaxID=388810 RepID=A0A4P9W0T2_9FUNG|nr:hypothetical protein BDK51DRAFT_36644 [Blyttiomyces helicus]|eukprot:RKO85704.1 hypothetical protein BDK51DRAFT_36644 [Blyttiomyces helicus]
MANLPGYFTPGEESQSLFKKLRPAQSYIPPPVALPDREASLRKDSQLRLVHRPRRRTGGVRVESVAGIKENGTLTMHGITIAAPAPRRRIPQHKCLQHRKQRRRGLSHSCNNASSAKRLPPYAPVRDPRAVPHRHASPASCHFDLVALLLVALVDPGASTGSVPPFAPIRHAGQRASSPSIESPLLNWSQEDAVRVDGKQGIFLRRAQWQSLAIE